MSRQNPYKQAVPVGQKRTADPSDELPTKRNKVETATTAPEAEPYRPQCDFYAHLGSCRYESKCMFWHVETAPGCVRPVVDYKQFTDEQIRKQLESRKLSSEGQRFHIAKRLRREVTRAWMEYYRKSKPEPFTPEEEEALEKGLEARRARNRQYLIEKKAAKDAKMTLHVAELKEQKEVLQKKSAIVKFSMKEYQKLLMEQVDPTGEKVKSVQYDMTKKGFRVMWATPELAEEAQNSSKSFSVTAGMKVFPAPVESRCVFFLYPCNGNHPAFAQAVGVVNNCAPYDFKPQEIRTLQLWVDFALDEFKKFGTIVRVFRERGFLVVQFSEAAGASAMMKAFENEGDLKGIPITYLQSGTPTKGHRKLMLAVVENIKAVTETTSV